MELTPAALTIASNLPVVPAAFLYEIPEPSSTRREEISAPWILNAAEAGAKSCVAARRRQGSICILTRPNPNPTTRKKKREKKELRERRVKTTLNAQLYSAVSTKDSNSPNSLTKISNNPCRSTKAIQTPPGDIPPRPSSRRETHPETGTAETIGGEFMDVCIIARLCVTVGILAWWRIYWSQ
jgi:hypothetical protein